MASKPRFIRNDFYYHCFNRGVDKRLIFIDSSDYLRFINSISISNNPETLRFKHGKKLETDRFVDVINYCLMPNHFHLTLKQVSENGISFFLHRLATSYTKYFNIKHKRSGRLFEYVFKAVEVSTDEQLIHLSRYIHLNPFVAGIVKEPEEYKWSSYLDYLGIFSNIECKKQDVLSFFNKSSYGKFVNDQKDYALHLELIKHLVVDNDE